MMAFRKKTLILSVLVGVCACIPVPVYAQSAAKWDKLGHEAEVRSDFDAAFEAYRQAHLLKPKDLGYQTRYEIMRSQASNAHADRGRVLRQSGDMAGAITEFSRALQIDRGNQSAAQELTTSQSSSIDSPIPIGPQAGHQRRVSRDIDSLDSPIELKPISNDPITLHMVEDSKNIYQAIGKLAGLNVIFDSDYTSRRIALDVTSVSLSDVLRIVGKIAGTFWSPLTSDTIFVAQDNRAKHTDNDDLAIETFYLTNVSQQSDANEVVTALRNVLDPSSKILLLASQNAIVVRATPAELLLVEKVIDDVDRTRPEVVVDVAVLEVSRDLERTLGITLPTSVSLTAQASNANQSSSSSSSSGITLRTLAHLNATNVAVSLSGATVNALLSDSDTRVLQNPRIRATDGQQATLKIGSKIPIATGSTTSTLTSTATSTTQFTYVDVGVNIDMTPTVHSDGEVSLKMKIEVSSQTGTDTIDGVAEPIISQRVVQQVIQLKDGEPSILAGLLQQTKTKTVSGTPGLGEMPFLKYFFSSRETELQSDEVVFLLIPHIVRESILTDANTRVIDSGTSQDIELRLREPKDISKPGDQADNATSGSSHSVQQTSAIDVASAMIGQRSAQVRNVAALGENRGVDQPSTGTPTSFKVISPSAIQKLGSTFQISIVASHATDLFSVPMQLTFDPKVVSVVSVDAGELLSRDGEPTTLTQRDNGKGVVSIALTRPPGTSGITGEGTVITLALKAVGPGDSTLALAGLSAAESKHASITAIGIPAVVHVR
jgi:general secretion pathway protein D